MARNARDILKAAAWIAAAIALTACAGSASNYTPHAAPILAPVPEARVASAKSPATIEVSAADRAAAFDFRNNRVHFTPPAFRHKKHRPHSPPPVGYPLDMSNYGGPTMPASGAYNIYVNCKNESCWGHPEEFLKGLTGSPFSDVITQYTGSSGSSYVFKDSVSVTYKHPFTNTYYTTDLFAILSAALRHFKKSGLSVEYNIFLPKGVDTCFDQTPICYSPDNLSAFQFCAYHGAAEYNHQNVVYSVLPYASPQVQIYGRSYWACQNQTIPKGVKREDSAQASALSHESFESWSDPLPNTGWYNAAFGAEIGDICAYTYMQTIELSGRKWYIQTEYSNAAHGCAATADSSSAAEQRAKAGQHLYAFSSNSTTTVASFPLDADGDTNPTWMLAGPKTRLQQGHGIAFDRNGVLYVMAGSPGQPLRLLQFGKDKSGNARPAAVYRFPSSSTSMLVDYTVGLGIDRSGNFWVSDAAGAKIRAFAIRGKKLEQIAAFEPKLHTSLGWRRAGPHGMYVDGKDHLYCWMSYLYQGIGEVGMTEYDIGDPARPRVKRSMFDPNFPDVPPDAMAIDGQGYVYAANSLTEIGVRIYPPKWKPAQLPVRIVGGYTQKRRPYVLGSVASLAVLPDGTLYVAAGTGSGHPPSIVVYAPGAAGNPQPQQIVTNAQFFQYDDGNDYGNLLAIK